MKPSWCDICEKLNQNGLALDAHDVCFGAHASSVCSSVLCVNEKERER